MCLDSLPHVTNCNTVSDHVLVCEKSFKIIVFLLTKVPILINMTKCRCMVVAEVDFPCIKYTQYGHHRSEFSMCSIVAEVGSLSTVSLSLVSSRKWLLLMSKDDA